MDNLHFPFINQTQNDRYGKADPLAFWLSDQLARKLGGHLNIKTRDGLGTRYSVHIKMLAADPEVEEEEERLLDDVCVMVDVTSAEIRNIVTRQLENWGATCITPDERLISQDYDIFLTDNPSNLTASGLLLSDDESGVREIGPGQLCVNFNMSNAMQEAVLQLIEVQLAQEEVTESPLGGDENAQLHASGYYALFVDTVPDDVKRLYTEAATSDFAALAQTAHRLKGVFAMLNLVPGKQLCETLEHLIREKDVPGIENTSATLTVMSRACCSKVAYYMNNMNVIIADDHPIVLFGIRKSLEQIEWVNVVGEFEDSTALINNLPKLDAHVLITDLSMPGDKYGDGITLIKYIKRHFPSLSIIVLTMNNNPAILSAVLDLDIEGSC